MYWNIYFVSSSSKQLCGMNRVSNRPNFCITLKKVIGYYHDSVLLNNVYPNSIYLLFWGCKESIMKVVIEGYYEGYYKGY